ncbi:hypothetical protein B0H19DRAFT_1057482 [Mycena capillaripes]|nr:hypothetical protein B0H19DRAFT_1057482 [Mycena capillaripes]
MFNLTVRCAVRGSPPSFGIIPAPSEDGSSDCSIRQKKKGMKAIWETRTKGVPVPKKRASKAGAIVVSEAHSSPLSMRTTHNVSFIDDFEIPEPPLRSNENSASGTASKDDRENLSSEPQLADALGSEGQDVDVRVPDFQRHNTDTQLQMPMTGVNNDERESSTTNALNVANPPDSELQFPAGTLPDVHASEVEPAEAEISAADQVPELGCGKHAQKARDVNLSQCYCDETLSSSNPGGIRCKNEDCLTKWYHLTCVGMDVASKTWMCPACLNALEDAPRYKRARRG